MNFLTKDTLYLILIDDLYGVYCEDSFIMALHCVCMYIYISSAYIKRQLYWSMLFMIPRIHMYVVRNPHILEPRMK